MKKREEYDWLNDPFDEKKIAEDQEQAKMSGCSRIGVLLAILGVLFLFVMFFVVACAGIFLGAGDLGI